MHWICHLYDPIWANYTGNVLTDLPWMQSLQDWQKSELLHCWMISFKWSTDQWNKSVSHWQPRFILYKAVTAYSEIRIPSYWVLSLTEMNTVHYMKLTWGTLLVLPYRGVSIFCVSVAHHKLRSSKISSIQNIWEVRLPHIWGPSCT